MNILRILELVLANFAVAVFLLTSVVINATVEYTLVILNLVTKNVFRADLEELLSDVLGIYRRCYMTHTFMTAVKILRIDIIFDDKNGDLTTKDLAIYTPTHTSFFDAMITVSVVSQRLYFIGKKSLERLPLVGILIKKCGHILIERENRQAAIGGLDQAAQIIKEKKKSVCIYPEGTRRRKLSEPSGEYLLPFKKGPFHMAKKAQAPIIPLTFQGLNRLTRGLLVKSGTILIRFCERVSLESVNTLDTNELLEITSERMHAAVSGENFLRDEVVFSTKRSRLYYISALVCEAALFFALKTIFW